MRIISRRARDAQVGGCGDTARVTFTKSAEILVLKQTPSLTAYAQMEDVGDVLSGGYYEG